MWIAVEVDVFECTRRRLLHSDNELDHEVFEKRFSKPV